MTSILNLHSQIIIPDESDFIVPLIMIVDRYKYAADGKKLLVDFISGTERFRGSIGEYLTISELKKAIEKAEYDAFSIVDSIYASIAEKHNKKMAGDKSPNDMPYLNAFQNAGFFEASSEKIKIIHIVRDSRDVVLSLMNTEWAPEGIEEFFPEAWAYSNIYLSKFMKTKHNYHLIRYEDLVLSPETEIKKICEFLNVSFEETMLAENRSERYVQQKHHKNINSAFLNSRVYAWKNNADFHLVNKIEKRSCNGLVYFGYEVDLVTKQSILAGYDMNDYEIKKEGSVLLYNGSEELDQVRLDTVFSAVKGLSKKEFCIVWDYIKHGEYGLLIKKIKQKLVFNQGYKGKNNLN